MASALYNQALERAKKMKAAGAVSSRVQPQDKTGWDPERSDQFNQIRQKLRQQISSGNYVSDVTDADVGQFLQDVRTYAIDTEKQLTTGGWSGTMDPATSAARASTARDLNDREIKIRQWAGINKATKGDEWYGEMVRYLDDFRKSQSIIDDEFKRSSEYYSQWDSQNAYDEYRNSDQYEKDIREAGYYQKYGQMSKQDINTAINSLPNGDEKQWLTDYYKTALRTVEDYDHEIAMIDWELGRLEKVYDDFSNTTRWVQDEADEQTNQKIERYRKNYGSPDAVKRRIKQLQTDRYDMEQGKKYNLLYQNDDYLENAQYAGKGTTLQDWVNDPEKADEQDTFGHVMRFVDPAVISPIMDALYYENVHLMTDDERRTFNYLHNTKGEAAAEEYMDWLQRALNTRSQQKRDSWVAERTKDIPVLSQVWTSMVSTPLRFMSAEGILDAAGQKIVNTVTGNDRPVDYNRDAMMFSRAGNTIRSSVSQQIADATHERVADAYNIAMSMQDSAAVAVATAVNPIAGKVASTLLSASAATDTMIAAADNGANDAQAITMGLAAGFFEWFFEKYEIESLLKQGKNVGTALLKQGFNEAVGESATELCNIVVNAYVMAENSDWYQNVEKHMAEHPEWDKSQAENAAMMDAIKQVLAAGTAGFVSGGIMGSGMAGINTVSGKIADRNDATAVAKDLYQSEAGRDRLMELAREIAAEQTGRSAKRMNSQIEKVGKEATLRNTRGLYRAVSDAYAGKTESELVEHLKEQGFSKRDAAALGKALTAEATGGIIGPEESEILQKYQYDDRLRETRSNLLDNEKSTVNQRRQNLSGLRVGAALDLQVQQLDMEQKAANRFTELGETENTEALSTAAAKAAVGQKLTAEEKKLLKASEHSTQIVEELKTQTKEQSQTPAADSTAAPTETTTTAPQEASTEGVAVRKDTGAPVTIKEVAAIKDGRMTLRLEDGATIEAANVDFGSEAEAIIYETVAKLANHPKAANLLINAFKTGDVSAYDYAKGIIEAHLYGSFGLSEQDMLSRESAVKKLTPHQRKVAYEIGQIFAGREIAKEHAAVRRPKGSKVSVKEGKVHFDGDRSKLNDTQKASLDAMEMLSKALGVQIYIFVSKTDTDGTHAGKNGWYDLSDGSIHIDLNAGMDGKGTMLFTAAHELTHFIRQWSPAKFKVLANFLISQYYEKGASVLELIDGQIAKAKRDNRTIDRDTAYEEVIADSMENMLTDGNVLQQLAELRQRDKTLWEKIREWFKDFANKLKAVIKTYDGVKPDSVEGRLVSDMQGVVEILEALYVDALTDASANYAAGAQKNTTGEGGVKHQARAVLYDYSKPFSQQVDDYKQGKIPNGDTLMLGGTPEVYQSIGFNALPMTINTTHVDYALNGTKDADHHMGEAMLKQLPDSMRNPIAVFISRTHGTTSVISLLNVVVNGKQIVAPIVIDGFGFQNNIRIDSNAITSIYGKTTAVKQLFDAAQDEANGNFSLLFVNKKEAVSLLQRAGHQLSGRLIPHDGFYHSIREKSSPVKLKMENVTESQQFKRWFGDWQKHPHNASKVVNSDGTPMIMYHGTSTINGDFYVFDETKAIRKGGLGFKALGKGNYFTSIQLDGTERYGNRVISAYLNIRNPFVYHGGISFSEYATTTLGIASDSTYDEIQQEMRKQGYDGVIQRDKNGEIAIAVTFDSEQIKSATDNIGTFDGTNLDIRYSTRDPAAQKLQQTLEKENAKLKEDVANLRELLKLQRTVTNGTKFTKTSVQAAAQWLKKSAGAKGDTKELVGLLNTFYEEIATSGTGSKSEIQLTWESLYDCAMPVVQWLQDHVDLKSERSEYAQNVLKQIRGNRIYLDESQKAEAAHRFGSFDNFRKSMMGSVTIVKDGNTSLDSFWQEMSATYPDIFNSETASGDMPGELFDIIGRLRNSDTSKVEYEYNRDLIAMDLLQDVYDSYWRVSAMRTFADTMQKKINVLRYKHRQQMSQLRSEKNAKIDSIKAEHRAELEQVRKEHRADTEAKVQDIRDKYTAAKQKALDETRENIAKRDAKSKLQRLVLETVRWISHPSKTDVKCPDLLKPAYSDFLNSIDMSSKRLAEGGKPTLKDLRLTNAMDSLATALERISAAQDPSKSDTKDLDIGYLDLPVDYVQTLRDMTEKIKKTMTEGDYVVNSMTAAQIRKLSQMIRTLNHSIKEMSKIYTTMRFSNVRELGGETMSFMDELGDIKKSGGAKDFVTWDNALPYYAFKRFGKGGEAIFEGLMDAQDKEAFLGKVILDFSQKTWNEKEAKAWSEDTHTIELPNGSKLTLTSADAMGIYCLSKRPQGLKHLLGGGIRVIGIQKGSKKSSDSRSLLTLKDIDAICATLSGRQVAVADAIQSFMSTVCAEWGNEISMKRFLTQEFTEQTYYPIESNDENLTTKDPAAQQSDLFRLLNISATKDLDKNANNEVIIRNIFDVFSSHTSDMARLNAYGMALLDYMKWLNYRVKTTNSDGQIEVAGVRKSMEQAYGKAAGSYVLNLIKDVNGRPSDNGDPGFLMRQLRNAKTASVGNSLRVATLQVTSYPRAGLVLSTRSLARGLAKKPQIEKAKKYCGIALWKSYGFYDTNISRSIEEQIKGTKNIRQKLIELSLKGAEWGDAITWGALWNACEYEVATTKKYDVGSEAFNQAVARKLREVVYRTQVVDSVLTRSQMMRSKRGMAQEASAFMSEPTLQANILMDASFEFNLEKRRTGSVKAAWKKCGKQIRKAVAVYSVGQLASTFLESLWDAWRDDDDESFWEKFKAAFGKNIVLNIIPFNKVPIVSDICEAVLAMFGVGYFSSDKLSSTWISQTVSAVDAWKDVFSGDSSVTAYNALYKSCRAVSSYFGVSGSGAMREVVALWNNTAGAFDSTWKIRQYDLSKTELGEQLYDAIIEGDADQEESLRAEFEDEESMTTALRKALRENDPRIQDAAKARQSMDTEEYLRIVEEIVDEGFFSKGDVVAAVRSAYNKLKGDDSHQQLYDAMVADDDVAVEKLKGNYVNDKGKFSDTSYHSAIQKGLRENEPRIQKAAEAKAAGDTDTYLEIVGEIVDEGSFKWKDVTTAVKAVVREMEDDEETDTET